jgi:hypothetical protein
MIDPRIQHLLACIPTEPLESSLAMRLEQKDCMHSSNRSILQTYWDRVRSTLHQAPETVPPLKNFFVVSLNAKYFTKSVAHRTEKNMIMKFVPSPLYDVRLDMRRHDKWISGSEAGIFVNIIEADLYIRPTNMTETGL